MTRVSRISRAIGRGLAWPPTWRPVRHRNRFRSPRCSSAGPDQLAHYTAGATLLTDDRMALEFSGPRALHASSAEENGIALGSLSENEPVAAADHWRRRGAMLFKADAYSSAYRDYMRALTLDQANGPALDGFVRSAVLAGRTTEAVAWLKDKRPAPTTAAELVASRSSRRRMAWAPMRWTPPDRPSGYFRQNQRLWSNWPR